jgi:hypothetical protein
LSSVGRHGAAKPGLSAALRDESKPRQAAMAGKSLEILKEVMPMLSRVAAIFEFVLGDVRSQGKTEVWLDALSVANRQGAGHRYTMDTRVVGKYDFALFLHFTHIPNCPQKNSPQWPYTCRCMGPMNREAGWLSSDLKSLR